MTITRAFGSFFVLALFSASACSFNGMGTASGSGGSARGSVASGGAAGRGPQRGAGGGAPSGDGDGDGTGAAPGGVPSGNQQCVPGANGPVITDCGYPMSTGSPLTSVVFNESDVLRAIVPSGGAPLATIRVFYNDEHALTLGVRSVIVKTAGGSSTTTDYPISPMATSPGSVLDPQTGTNQLVGSQSGLDPSLRPMWPALFITDITADPNSRAGDWQHGGRPRSPQAVFGTWKGAVRTVDATVTPNKITITPDADPAKNSWDLAGGGPVPAGLKNEGFGTEARWNVPLVPGHSYRIQAMVHDGDQNKEGGDSGEACVVFCASGSGGGTPVPDGGTPPPTGCPNGLVDCTQRGVDPVTCPSETVCANGCCVPAIL